MKKGKNIIDVENEGIKTFKKVKNDVCHSFLSRNHHDLEDAVKKIDSLLSTQKNLLIKVNENIEKYDSDIYAEAGAVQAEIDDEFVTILDSITNLLTDSMAFFKNRKEFFKDYVIKGYEVVEKANEGEKLKNYVDLLNTKLGGIQKDIDAFIEHTTGILNLKILTGSLPLMTKDIRKLAKDAKLSSWDKIKPLD
jgi:hypothetical protein